MLDKSFRPEEAEPRLYAAWEKANAFKAGLRAAARPFSIVIPPPNVTGSLHMGHALNNTLQDILARFERMRGRDVLWQPGTDHAGIATQMVVERQLALEQSSRQKLGREKFIERVWAWKAQSGGTIVGQLRRLGCSCDWSRERFTMDEGLSRAVTKVFVELHKKGLVYKDKRLVNWDPKLGTAISDLEVVAREVKGHLWYIKYPLADDPSQYVVVATTRPETMLGDAAVAVHPDHPRYAKLVGKDVLLPLVGRRIPVIADEYADPELGTGAVKITPAHDVNDFEVGRRHKLPLINIFNADATLNEAAPAPYRGLDRFEARKRIVAELESGGHMQEVQPHTHFVPHGDRSDAVIEPWLTDQWYLNVKPAAEKAIAAVERGETVFVPRNWEKTYFQWMRNIEPWCISRQLWWGHQIPAWYDAKGNVFVAETEAEARTMAQGGALTRDPDVLDTWFSSQLWPFSTLGWPEKTKELQRYYPTDVLVTGFDIIFFWVARMMMAGLEFMSEAPFKTVYIHALVRDEKGAKMSKSKGNVMDPLDLIGEVGADALRMTLAAMAAQGRDIKLSRPRIEGYRNFANKLWNAARFAQMNGCQPAPGFDPNGTKQVLNRWILGEAMAAVHAVTEALEGFRFNDAANAAYSFVWHIFCDWYVELVKPVFAGGDEAAIAETRAVTGFVLDKILMLLHPFMPFITEELWQGLAPRKALLALSDWPRAGEAPQDAEAMAEISWLIDLVAGIRSVRAEMNVPAAAQIPAVIIGADAKIAARIERYRALATRLARLSSLEIGAGVPPKSVQIVLKEAVAALLLEGIIDIDAEKQRLLREADKARSEAEKIRARLADSNFVARAPEEIIEENRDRLAEHEARAMRLEEALSRL